MKKNKPFTPADLAIEIESLIADKHKPQSKSEITAWLVRLYPIAAKLTLIQEACQTTQLTDEEDEIAREIVSEFVPNMLLLHKMAEDALANLKGV